MNKRFERKKDNTGVYISSAVVGLGILSGIYFSNKESINNFFSRREKISPLEKEQVIVEPKRTRQHHIVNRGETGYRIARNLNISFEELKEYNPNLDWNRIAPGDTIWTQEK